MGALLTSSPTPPILLVHDPQVGIFHGGLLAHAEVVQDARPVHLEQVRDPVVIVPKLEVHNGDHLAPGLNDPLQAALAQHVEIGHVVPLAHAAQDALKLLWELPAHHDGRGLHNHRLLFAGVSVHLTLHEIDVGEQGLEDRLAEGVVGRLEALHVLHGVPQKPFGIAEVWLETHAPTIVMLDLYAIHDKPELRLHL